MAGLSDIHLFSKFDLMSTVNPIYKYISNRLNSEIKTPETGFASGCSSEQQIGSVPVKINKPEWKNLTVDNSFSDFVQQRLETIYNEVGNKINNHLNAKCEEYCRVNRISFNNWVGFAVAEYSKNRWEIRYKGELVCGARVVYELKPGDFKLKTNVSLELY